MIECVVILVDRDPVEIADLGHPRPDVATALGSAPAGSGHTGWSATFELPDRVGAHVAIGALALTAAGLVERFDPVSLKTMENVGRVADIEPSPAGRDIDQ
jgi:hypothetical protein